MDNIYSIIIEYIRSPTDKFNVCKILGDKYYSYIKNLQFTRHTLDDLYITKNCKKLEILSIQDTVLYNSPILKIIVENCRNIFILNLHGSRLLRSIDFVFDLPNIKYLDVCHSHSKESFKDNLYRLHKLKISNLYAGSCMIRDMSPYVSIPSLKLLDLTNNVISVIPRSFKCTHIKTLYLNNNTIRDLSPISELIHLERLTLSGTRITDISPLSVLTKLILLEIENTRVLDLSPLYNLPLQYLNIRGTYITSADLPEHFTNKLKLIY